MSAGKGILIDPDLRLLRWTVRTGIILLVLLGAVPKVQDAAAHPVALVALRIARAATWWRRLDADAAGAVWSSSSAASRSHCSVAR